jgi:outer membrane protein assembly factor BamD
VKRYLSILGFFLIVLAGCGGGKPTSNLSSSIEQRFSDGKKAYEEKNWLEAISAFDDVRLQGPASKYAAEATFLEGMSRYYSETYISAAVDFRSVRRTYPSSDFAPRSQFMIAESYYQLSPRAELDQNYTQYAINEYQTFLREYSNAKKELLDSAEMRIAELRNKLGQKILLSAELYLKLLDNKSAIQYFGRVVETYYDTPSAVESQLRIAEVQYDRKKMKEAQEALGTFDEKFLGNSTKEQRERALKLRQQLTLK